MPTPSCLLVMTTILVSKEIGDGLSAGRWAVMVAVGTGAAVSSWELGRQVAMLAAAEVAGRPLKDG